MEKLNESFMVGLRSTFNYCWGSLRSGLRLAVAFFLCGVVGIPLLHRTFGMRVEEATAMLAVPLIVLYVIWRTLRIFFSPEISRENGARPRNTKGRSNSSHNIHPKVIIRMRMTSVLFVFFVISTFILVIALASAGVYAALRMERAVMLCRGFLKLSFVLTALLGIAVDLIALHRHWIETALQIVAWFMRTPKRVYTMVEAQVINTLGIR